MKSYSEEKNTETKRRRTYSVLCSFSVWQLHSQLPSVVPLISLNLDQFLLDRNLCSERSNLFLAVHIMRNVIMHKNKSICLENITRPTALMPVTAGNSLSHPLPAVKLWAGLFYMLLFRQHSILLNCILYSHFRQVNLWYNPSEMVPGHTAVGRSLVFEECRMYFLDRKSVV